MDGGRHVVLFQVELLQQRAEEDGLVELQLVFPVELAPVDDSPVPQVEEVDGDQRRLGIAGQDIGVIAAGCRHLLALFHLFHGDEQIAQTARFLEAHFVGSLLHALAQLGRQIAVAAFEKQPHIADRA